MQQTTGLVLRRLRKERKLSQRELGKLADGLSHTAIGQIERGERPYPSGDTVRRLARALGVTADALLPDDTASVATPEQVRAAYPQVNIALEKTLSNFPAEVREEVDAEVAELAEVVIRRRRERLEREGK